MENNVFNHMAAKYDTEDRKELANVIANEINRILDGKNYYSLLDYGGGTGLVTFQIAKHFNEILLLDSSHEMIKVAQSKIDPKQDYNFEARLLNLMEDNDLGFKADVIILSLVLLHIPDIETLLQKLFNVLNKDGMLILIDFDKNESIYHPKVHNGFVQDEIMELLIKIGFYDIEMHTFYHGKNIFMSKDASLFSSISKK